MKEIQSAEVELFTRRAIESYRGDDLRRAGRLRREDPSEPYGDSGMTCGQVLAEVEHRDAVAVAALERLEPTPAPSAPMCRIERGKHTSYIHFPNLPAPCRLAVHMDVDLASNEDRAKQREESRKLLEYLAALIPGCVIEGDLT